VTTYYITPADIAARVTADLYLQLFDRDEDGTVNEVAGPDADALTTAIATSQSVVDTELEIAYPDGLLANGGVVDPRVKAAQVMIALYESVRYSPAHTGDKGSTFRAGYDEALKMLERVRRVMGAHLVTGAGGAEPRQRTGDVQNATTTGVNGTPVLPYTRAADGRDPSAF
jgi:hypothetical protein